MAKDHRIISWMPTTVKQEEEEEEAVSLTAKIDWRKEDSATTSQQGQVQTANY